ncbi:hypothetical protein AN958_04242 [Leucoagaricus sp. SymC.cos]|nr:hypothetical protein AN958_04242 [Leucoagaricus sp. SymC.cos]
MNNLTNLTTAVIERDRGRTSQVSTGGSTGALHLVKRSLSGHGYGPSSGAATGTAGTTETHSLSLSTSPPLPSHSEKKSSNSSSAGHLRDLRCFKVEET